MLILHKNILYSLIAWFIKARQNNAGLSRMETLRFETPFYNMPPQKNGKYGKQERENLKFVHTYYPGLGFSMRFPARHGLPL